MIRQMLGEILYAIRSQSFPKPEPEPRIMSKIERYSSYEIGEWSYGTPRILFPDAGARLRIGRFCSIAEDTVIFLGGEHQTKTVTTYPLDILFPKWVGNYVSMQNKTKGDVTIGHDVWIGKSATILSGVTVGNGAVIGAESLVAADVEPYSIVAGNPARHIRYRFPKLTIEALQEIAWWDWSEDRIAEAMPLLLSTDVDAFIAKYSKKAIPKETMEVIRVSEPEAHSAAPTAP